MRTSLLVGLSLALTAAVAVVVSSLFDLQIESVALLGAATGAVLALVPDTTPLARMGGALLGVLASLVGFALRAAELPDTAGGRAVAVVVVILLCTVVAVVSRQRIALWAPLLGAAAFAGAYERVYAVAPAELPDTALTTVTALLMALAVGFLATSWAAPRTERGTRTPTTDPRPPARPGDEHTEPTTDLETLLNREAAGTDARMENAR
ncbi:hypothetical protein G7072_13485 [Nocardioides sp. HDW12B]|uniref:hypothetical protein n=1 Tax=Nocardioides sp. HDW12B TaxID=2714939 RepID=UPI00140CAD99|nr:hypothetical protein [Nocardioides sp. HDW12B]QIK67221.1 hypothetical protein G7072_13485 [Nocardioides sp. HDW12B]